MDKPKWGRRTETQRLDWLLEHSDVSGLSGDKAMDRKAIDDAIAREEFKAATKRGEKHG